MIIRLANQKDKENVLSLLDELISEVHKKMGSSNQHKGNKSRCAFYDQMLKRDDIKIFVAEENGTLVGLAELFVIPILRRGYYQGVIESFVITQGMRDKGIGSKLFQKIIDYCKEKKIPVIKINSGIELEEAHKFYEKHGGKFTEKLFRFDLDKI